MRFATVLVLDDHPLMAGALVGALQESAPKARFVTTHSLAEAKIHLAKHSFDLIFADLGLPDSQGPDIVSKLREQAPTSVIAVYSAQRDRDIAFKCLDQGAMAFISKNDDAIELKRALKLLMAGKVYLSVDSLLTKDVPTALSSPVFAVDANHSLAGLSPRQTEVFQLLVRGLDNKTIARQLDISVATVKIHIAAVLRHFDVHNRVQLLVKVAEKLSFPALAIS